MPVFPVDVQLTPEDKELIEKSVDYLLGSIFGQRINKACTLQMCIRFTDTDISFQLANYSEDEDEEGQFKLIQTKNGIRRRRIGKKPEAEEEDPTLIKPKSGFSETRICFLLPQKDPIVSFFKKYINHFKSKEGTPNICLMRVEYVGYVDGHKPNGEEILKYRRVFKNIEFFNMTYLDLSGVVNAKIFQ